ncbi:hypothetical protein [Paenibacillus sp. NRS-1760]|uniref:hypothetical protein n=1 Tax=Paenibacillus sp. NRS-1760 TaxID=3233902 RepID=UPI003D2CD395
MNHNTKQSFFNAAKQSAVAKQWAQMKANSRFKREKLEKQPYKPGKSVLGLSTVSEAIMTEYDELIQRRDRRLFERKVAKGNRELVDAGLLDAKKVTPMLVFYNGDGPVKVPHNIKPSKYRRARG